MYPHHGPAPDSCGFTGAYESHDDHLHQLEPACSAAPEYILELNGGRNNVPRKCPHCGRNPSMLLCEKHTMFHLEHCHPGEIKSVLPFSYTSEEMDYLAELAELEEGLR